LSDTLDAGAASAIVKQLMVYRVSKLQDIFKAQHPDENYSKLDMMRMMLTPYMRSSGWEIELANMGDYSHPLIIHENSAMQAILDMIKDRVNNVVKIIAENGQRPLFRWNKQKWNHVNI